MVPNECYLSKHNIYHLIHQHFGHVSSARLKQTARKVLMKGLPTNLPDLKDTYPIYILTKQLASLEVWPYMSQNVPLSLCFKWILRSSMLKNPWIYLDFCDYMIFYFIIFWIYIQKKTSDSWYPKIPYQYIEELV